MQPPPHNVAGFPLEIDDDDDKASDQLALHDWFPQTI